jgi:hypothetical protein
MPNWCSNYLTITAEPPVITALLAKAKGKASPHSDQERQFSYLPFLQEKIDACEDFAAQWYGFMLANVGCKWFPDIDPDALCVEDGRVSVPFSSPWSPPVEGTRAIAEWMRGQGFAFRLQLTYEESGCAFCGVFTADEDGEEDLCGEYVEPDAAELRQGKAEDYADLCKSFGISFAHLQAQATEDMEYVTLCPDFYREHAR